MYRTLACMLLWIRECIQVVLLADRDLLCLLLVESLNMGKEIRGRVN